MTSPYEVGYKKPPLASRFKKGTSGNPKGRPKRPFDLKRSFVTELKSLVTIVEEGGKTKRISKIEALQKSLWKRAIKGDNTAAKLLLDFAKNLPESAFVDEESGVHTFRLTQSQMASMQEFLEETSSYYQTVSPANEG
jgi:N-acetylglucosamine kinase-like BadF-type ATPase